VLDFDVMAIVVFVDDLVILFDYHHGDEYSFVEDFDFVMNDDEDEYYDVKVKNYENH
jgi:hypothetical protein